MRLGTCIALEIAIAAGAVSGVAIGVGRMAELAGDYVTPPAEAANHPAPVALPRAHLPVSFPPAPTTIFDASDADMLDALGDGKVTGVKVNHGGTSLSLRLDFANGTRASFKPEQTFLQSDPRREIAAYRIDRLLGIGHVSPAKAAAIPYQDLLDAAGASTRSYVAERLDDAIVRDGIVHGEIQWWLPEIELAAFGRHRLDEDDGKDLWRAYFKVGTTIPAEHLHMCEQLSTLIVFDALIDNSDRWSGANLRMSPDGQTLYFMDNTLSFSKHKIGHEKPNTALRRTQRFSKRLVARLRGLTYEQVERALGMPEGERLGPLLPEERMRAIIARRDNILSYIDKLIAEYGEEAVLAFP